MKKLKKVWGKIKILETSAVGIPVYPAAHKSYSLVKSLQETEDLVSDELNLEENSMGEEETEKPEEKSEEDKSEGESEESNSGESESEEKTETTTEAKAEAPAVKPGEAPEENKSVKKTLINKMIGLINQKVEDQMIVLMDKAINASKTSRGLVDSEEKVDVKAELKKKSLGELAIMSGLFKEPIKLGSNLEVIE